MSPDLGIEPGRLVRSQRLGELVASAILTKGPDREGYCVAHGRAEIMGQPLQFLVGIRIYPNASRMHA
jgi:hypothetical protein